MFVYIDSEDNMQIVDGLPPKGMPIHSTVLPIGEHKIEVHFSKYITVKDAIMFEVIAHDMICEKLGYSKIEWNINWHDILDGGYIEVLW